MQGQTRTGPLPLAARRAIKKYGSEQLDPERTNAVNALLSSGLLPLKQAKALRLYAGSGTNNCRTYKEVGLLLNISKERVRQLLRPSKLMLEAILRGSVPWRPIAKQLSISEEITSR